jgi:hypothetical protein
MASYAGITLELKTRDGLINSWSAEQNVTVTHIPGSDQDDVQFGGMGNRRVTWPVLLASVADYNALRAAQGPTLRTFTNDDATTISNVMLLRVGAPQKHISGIVIAEAEFMVGAA